MLYTIAQPFSNGPSPNRTCNFHCIRLSSSPGFPVSAIGISPTFTATLLAHLPPFAMWPAFPSADYYGGSVPMRVAPFRESRISSGLTFRSV